MANEAAQELRTKLKSAGYNARQVSVRSPRYSAIIVTIRDPKVEGGPVEAIARQYESIRYCQYSGEILQGGNTFVRVEYSDEAAAARASVVQPAVEAALAEANRVGPGYVVEVGNTGYSISQRRNNPSAYKVWKGDRYWGQANAGSIADTMVNWVRRD